MTRPRIRGFTPVIDADGIWAGWITWITEDLFWTAHLKHTPAVDGTLVFGSVKRGETA